MAKISGPVGYELNMTGPNTSRPSRITQRGLKGLPVKKCAGGDSSEIKAYSFQEINTI